MSANPESKDQSVKIHLTMPKRWVDVLEILARDPGQKSTELQYILRDYIYTNKNRLEAEGTWAKIQEALRSGVSENPLLDITTKIDEYVKTQPNNIELQKYWAMVKADNDEKKIRNLYNKIQEKIAATDLDKII